MKTVEQSGRFVFFESPQMSVPCLREEGRFGICGTHPRCGECNAEAVFALSRTVFNRDPRATWRTDAGEVTTLRGPSGGAEVVRVVRY